MTENPPPGAIAFFLVLTIWILIWKGIALWHAAKHNQKRWFIGLIIVLFPVLLYNTLGLVDIIYLFFFAKKKLTFSEIKLWFQKIFAKKS